MKNSQRGEIMTALTIISLVVIGISTVVSSVLLRRNKQTYMRVPLLTPKEVIGTVQASVQVKK